MAGAAGLLIGGVLEVKAADPWASVAGGITGLVGLAVTLYGVFGKGTGQRSDAVLASGDRSIAAGGNISIATTGNGVRPAPGPPLVKPRATPKSARASGSVTAEGERSIAAGGDIGNASTGDT